MRTIALVSITLAPRNSATNHHCAAQPRHSFPARFCMSSLRAIPAGLE